MLLASITVLVFVLSLTTDTPPFTFILSVIYLSFLGSAHSFKALDALVSFSIIVATN